MRIRIQGTADSPVRAKERLDDLLRQWDQESSDVSSTSDTNNSEQNGYGQKGVDPVALTALVVSIPSAALAVLDIADRISKRRRAEQFLEHIRELSTQGVTITFASQDSAPEITALTPDQLLDRNTDE
ncbi:hypothetical protein ACSVDM_03460 [Nocardia sp. JW2]|uniref:hypothetical protein n=1 Tax=Nocardia sp. JW2 TaxID=3450738 RepID=UPI003F41CB30